MAKKPEKIALHIQRGKKSGTEEIVTKLHIQRPNKAASEETAITGLRHNKPKGD